jgi:predicted small metal-binding protein
MKKVLHCECGYAAGADDEAGLVIQVQRHALEAHGMRLSPKEVLQLALHAHVGDETPADGRPLSMQPTRAKEGTSC